MTHEEGIDMSTDGDERTARLNEPEPDHETGSPEESGAEDPGMPDLGYTWTTGDLDDDWEARARQKLETVDFDTELGVELSRDAMALAQGELSREAFNEKHHAEVHEEFGVDERPTREVEGVSYESDARATRPSSESGDPLPDVPAASGRTFPSRRGMLKSMGAAAAAGATAGLAGCMGGLADTGPERGDEGDVQFGMAIDTDRCIACMLCAEACKRENDTDAGTHWMHVFRYEEDEYGEVEEGYMPRPCQHCSEPSCTYVCPTQARFKRNDDGLVLTDYDTCIGCKYCEVACPYGVNSLSKDEPTDISSGFTGSETDKHGNAVGGTPPEGVMGKCTFCVHRQDDSAQRGTTACEEECPVDAIHFGDMNDPESKPRRYLRENRQEARFKLLDEIGNEPNIVYLGDEPSKDAEPIDGPYTYEDLGMERPAEDGAGEVVADGADDSADGGEGS